VIVVDPRGLTPREWCDYTADNLSGIMSPMKVDRDEDWRRFGAYALAQIRRFGVLPPDPLQFDDFEEWAFRFNQVIAPVEAR
jgi:hypothetical protein